MLIKSTIYKPTIIFISKGNGISIYATKILNRISETILWYMDPLDGNFNDELREKIKECSLIVCGLRGPFEESKKINEKSYFVHEGFDPMVDCPINVEEKEYDVSFIGKLKGKRKDYHKLYDFNIINGVYGKDHSQAVSLSKINLNFVVDGTGTSDRTYKIMASKGFLLTEPWFGIEKDFVIGKDLDVFTSDSDFLDKINYYLINRKKRMKIASSGYRAVQKYSRNEFVKEIIKTFYIYK
tara:strand:+ start:364 stop:1083 length:720 start_codon:yes stop_codon:yes gene_type:complete